MPGIRHGGALTVPELALCLGNETELNRKRSHILPACCWAMGTLSKDTVFGTLGSAVNNLTLLAGALPGL